VRRSRQALTALAVAGLASAACLVLIVILASRDPSGVGSTSTAPGTLQPDRGAEHVGADAPPTPVSAPAHPPTSGPHRPQLPARDAADLSDDQLLEALHLGNVVIAYDSARPPAELRTLQRDVMDGAFSPDLAAAGQAVILDHRPGAGGIIALAWRRELRTQDPADPQLREFADAWLGQGP
jgi:Protein of unknown function (DUF3105)